MKDRVVDELLKDPFAQDFLREFGLEKSSPDKKAELLERTGEHLLKHLALEIFKTLPESEHAQFSQLLFNGKSIEEWRMFLEPHIDDVDAFIVKTMRDEIAAMREAMKTEVR